MNAVHTIGGVSTALDVVAVRRDFPVLERTVRGLPLSYLDNAASSQRPRAVIDAMSHYYENSHANVHRGVHTLSQEATDLFEGAREKVRRFINAKSTQEIVFVRGTTEAINLVAQSYGRPTFEPGDEILVSWLEHHANIVPWQILCQQTGATLKVAPITTVGRSGLRRVRCPALLAHQAGGAGARLECARHRHPGASFHRGGQVAWRAGAARWRAGRAPHESGRAGARLRFLCLLRPQDVWPDRHRGALWP